MDGKRSLHRFLARLSHHGGDMPPIEINLLFELRVILGNAPPCAPRMPFTASRVRVREFASVTPPIACSGSALAIHCFNFPPTIQFFAMCSPRCLSQPLVYEYRVCLRERLHRCFGSALASASTTHCFDFTPTTQFSVHHDAFPSLSCFRVLESPYHSPSCAHHDAFPSLLCF